MAVEIRTFDFTIPAGTPIGAPVVLDCSFPPRIVDVIEVIVPPGPNGQVGFQVLNSQVPVIPYSAANWIVTSNEKIVWPLDNFINSGSWQVRGYNTGTQDHTVYFRFLVDLVPAANPPTAPTLAVSSALAGQVVIADTDGDTTTAPFTDDSDLDSTDTGGDDSGA